MGAGLRAGGSCYGGVLSVSLLKPVSAWHPPLQAQVGCPPRQMGICPVSAHGEDTEEQHGRGRQGFTPGTPVQPVTSLTVELPSSPHTLCVRGPSSASKDAAWAGL